MEKKRKLPSPFVLKTLKRAKVNNVKMWLKAYQTKKTDPASGLEQPLIVFYYEVSASDGSYFKTTDLNAAQERFEALQQFEKRQLCITI